MGCLNQGFQKWPNSEVTFMLYVIKIKLLISKPSSMSRAQLIFYIFFAENL